MIRPFQQLGFTLIEMIVSLAVFSVVVTIAVGALLVLISGNQRLQGEQSVMTNVAFALDSMTREIRTGYNYYCANSANASGVFNPSYNLNELDTPAVQIQDCPSGRPNNGNGTYQGVAFFEGGDSLTGGVATDNRILYYYDATAKSIFRRIGSGAPQRIISSDLDVVDANFVVTGTDEFGSVGDLEQPTVTIFLKVKEKKEAKTYEIETTVTQRILDL